MLHQFQHQYNLTYFQCIGFDTVRDNQYISHGVQVYCQICNHLRFRMLHLPHQQVSLEVTDPAHVLPSQGKLSLAPMKSFWAQVHFVTVTQDICQNDPNDLHGIGWAKLFGLYEIYHLTSVKLHGCLTYVMVHLEPFCFLRCICPSV